MISLDEVMNRYDAMPVPLNLLEDVIGLDLGQDLYHCLLESSSCHQRCVIGCSKPLFPNLDLLDRLHSVSDLVIHLIHEVANSISLCTYGLIWRAVGLKDQDVTLLFEIDFVQDLDARRARIQIVVEMANVLPGKSVKFSNLENARNCFLECDLVSVIHLHETDMDEVDANQSIDCIILDGVSCKEVTHDCQIK